MKYTVKASSQVSLDVVDRNNDGNLILQNKGALRNKDVYFQDFIAWSKLASVKTGSSVSGGVPFSQSPTMLAAQAMAGARPCAASIQSMSM